MFTELGWTAERVTSGIVWFCIGLFTQWAYQKIFGDLFREMDVLAERIRKNYEIEKKNAEYNWAKSYYKKRAVEEYSQLMQDLAQKMASKKIDLTQPTNGDGAPQ
jgi:hypothetical protein